MSISIPTLGLAGGFVLFLLSSIPTLWHRSHQEWWVGVLRGVCWVVAMALVVLGMLPILGIL